MRRDIVRVLIVFSIILLAPSSLAQSTVELEGSISMGDGDLGIEGISVSVDQGLILAHGANSGVFLIDSNSPENNSHIEWSGDYSLLDSSFHPREETAIIVGEGGNVLRVTLANSSIEQAGGPSTFGDTLLTSVSWERGWKLGLHRRRGWLGFGGSEGQMTEE
jgi:hypothetical protein